MNTTAEGRDWREATAGMGAGVPIIGKIFTTEHTEYTETKSGTAILAVYGGRGVD
jgi:hypothetical protein